MRELQVIDLGRCRYAPALEQQERLLEKRVAGTAPDSLILVEHEPVYTLGRTANAAHVIASREELERSGVEVFETSRGGDVTYHGPGQLVGYPIISLRDRKGGVLWYVETLEQVLIDVLAEYDITAQRNPVNRGVWIGDSKIAALGVRVTRHTTMHGFALNVHTDLQYYNGIVPCGLTDKGVVSLHQLRPEVELNDVKQCVIKNFCRRFDCYVAPHRRVAATGET